MHSKNKLLLTIIVISILASCTKDIANRHSTGKNIICFGDSITSGYGARGGEDYPSVLAKLLLTPVINAGVNGNTSRQALERIEEDVLAKNPKLVIVEFGANDFFKKIPKEETRINLEKIVSLIQERGGMVAVVGVRLGLLADEYNDVFSSVAKERKAIYVPNVLKDIFTDPDKKSDEIHPNAKGYEIIARRIYKKIKPYIE